MKLFPPHLVRLREEHGIELLQWFPGLQLILLRRRDLLDQAVSLALATQTNRWVKGNSARLPARYDRRLVLRMLNHLVEWEAFWSRYLALEALSARELFYEDLAADPAGQLGPLLAGLELPLVAGSSGKPWLGPQRDAVNADWRARFLEAVERHGYRLDDRPRRRRAGPESLGEWLRGRLRRPPFAL